MSPPLEFLLFLLHPPGNFHSKIRIREAHAIECGDFCRIIFLVVETGSIPQLLNYRLLLVNDANSMLL